MKVKEEYVLKTVGNQTIVVPTGKEAVRFQGMITLNKTAKFLFLLLKEEQSEDTLVQKIIEHYEVDEQRARTDVKAFIELLEKHQLLETV